ncbi:SPOR domain-containing protein [Spirosoma utsteinense]|uniref:Cell division septation protein DedD n=1 Tax=Spirosoma utsteinense TaxID=2585773 RepID=A0ABR6VZQ7_9BACT|nr:SPOR domain-containing protein [Spirosoma utsteinense]MBC3784630.1 cell division septation protein DedD [Spirosoma utsteinense]MBC3789617.1 cell division septation protein DedD [Spirosoma utsteinense]
MAAVNDYLKKLLYQYDCVVVPELGAFLTHYQPASFTESSGLFLPPRKRVAFNEALRLDDGILANYIMLHEPVTRDGAQRHISLFVNELRRQVAESGRFEIDGIGTFTVNEEEKLQFDPSLRHNFYGEAYGMSAISAQSLTKQAIEAVVVESPSTAVGPVLTQDEETSLMPMPRSRPYWRIAAAALLVGSLGFISYFTVVKPGQPLQSSLDPAMLLRIPAALFEKAGPANEVVKPVTAVTRPAPIVPAKAVPVEKTTVPVTNAPVPELAKANIPAAVPVVVKPVEVATALKTARTTPYFTVIAGSFSSKRNALRLKRQLRKAGYTDAFVIMPSRRGQLYKVAAAGSDNRDEAIAGVGSISKLAGTAAWIYKN